MSATEIVLVLAAMCGGLALFLFGMDRMSDSLGEMTGGVLGKVTGFITRSRFTAFVFGALLTAMVQSSSAITVLSVGLVNAGIIELSKAAGLLIGANLGTTATAWVLSLNAVEGQSLLMTLVKPSTFSPFLALIGVAFTMFSKSEKKKTVGLVLLGFSVMMMGMNMMSQGVAPLKEVPAVQNALISFSNPVLGFLFALAFTMLIQSSDATIGIIQAFALTIGVTFGSAIPLICGAQVGTCITAIFASMGASNNGKRTACINLYYNLLKTIPFMVVFYLLNGFFHFDFLDASVGAIGIPIVHTIINLIGAAIWLPLANVLVSLAKHTVKLSKEEMEEQENTLTMLDPILLDNPTFALEQADRAVSLLAETAEKAFYTLSQYRADSDDEETVHMLCRRTSSYHDQISSYLAQISSQGIKEDDASMHTLLVNTQTAFAKIGSVTEQILTELIPLIGSETTISERVRNEVRLFGEVVYETIDLTSLSFQRKDPMLSATVQIYREEISRLSTMVGNRLIEHMHQGDLDHSYSAYIYKFLYVEEGLIDGCDIVADALLKYARAAGQDVQMQPAQIEKKRQQVRELFKDKYDMLEL